MEGVVFFVIATQFQIFCICVIARHPNAQSAIVIGSAQSITMVLPHGLVNLRASAIGVEFVITRNDATTVARLFKFNALIVSTPVILADR